MVKTNLNPGFTFSHLDVPPSFNEAGARGHWRKIHGEKKKWQGIFENLLMVILPRKKYKRIIVSASLRFSTKRRRDEGNYRTIIEKCMGDALVNGGWLADDTAESFVFQHVFFEEETGTPRTTIHIRVEE